MCGYVKIMVVLYKMLKVALYDDMSLVVDVTTCF